MTGSASDTALGNYPTFAANWHARIMARGPAEDCRIVAISLTGARVARTSTKALPATFRLVIPDPRFTASCTIADGTGDLIDVRFQACTSVPLPLLPA